jgi:hypothetical protein
MIKLSKVNKITPQNARSALMTLKQKFKIALAAKNANVPAFAKDLGVSETAIYRVLDGTLTSRKIETAIKNFIEVQFQKMRIQPKQDSK